MLPICILLAVSVASLGAGGFVSAAPVSGASPNGAAMVRPADRAVRISDGVLRWADTDEEVALFGVNYYAAFSLDYHAIRQLGGDHRREIDRDIAHMVRLGLNLLRMHVFDREIADGDGNLTPNEHLDLCDYVISRCRAAGIYVLLTPIAWWPTPNRNDGFSSRYPMRQMTSDPAARAAQTRYLTQFLAHVNPFTGLSYADDPAIIAVEPINEPIYPAGMTDAEVTSYINALASAIRRSGCRKPILYNGWEGRHAAVRDAAVDGCTFNWYPTGLMNGHALAWNVLPALDRHPDMHDPILDGKLKAVYEYDPADVSLSCVHPAMARSFRAGGAQLAAQFQYDPVLTAGMNLSWQTHHMNLCYTPAKAISLMIAGEAFRRLPRGRAWGSYPGNRRFGDFEVSYDHDISLMNASDRYCHSGATPIQPKSVGSLRHIAGCGSSPIVQYEGSGAYFLDWLAEGVWRLEVYPDAVPAADPYAHPYIGREVVRLVHRSRRMTIRLSDLGLQFTIEPGSGARPMSAQKGTFTVRPGAYLLKRDPRRKTPSAPHNAPTMPEGNNSPGAWHEPPRQWRAGKPLTVVVGVVAPREPVRVDLVYRAQSSNKAVAVAMQSTGACRYKATIPGSAVVAGRLRYEVRVTDADGVRRYPSGLPAGKPLQNPDLFSLNKDTPLKPDSDIAGNAGRRATAMPGLAAGRLALRLEADALQRDHPSGGAGVEPWVGQGFDVARPQQAPPSGAVSACIRSIAGATTMQIGLTEPDGTAFAADVAVTEGWREVTIPLYQFAAVDRRGEGRTVRTISGIWFSLLGRLTRTEGLQSVEIAWARLRPQADAWEVPIAGKRGAVSLFAASQDTVWSGNPVSHVQYMVSGMGGRTLALRLAARDLGIVVGFRRDCSDAISPRREDLEELRRLRIRARWAETRSSSVQVVLIEQDGTPWGADAPISGDWADVTVRLASFRHLREWRAGPAHRGIEGDRPRLSAVVAVNILFGAWLDPNHGSEPHTLDVQEVALEP